MTHPGPDQPTEGRFVGSEHRLPIRIYFEDTDLSGVVYHANYLRFKERARSDMLRVAGIDQRAAQEAGEGAYAVVSLAIRYAAPARLDVRCWSSRAWCRPVRRASSFIRESCAGRSCSRTPRSWPRWSRRMAVRAASRLHGAPSSTASFR